MFTVEISVNRNGKIEGIVSCEKIVGENTKKIDVLGKVTFKDLATVESFRLAARQGNIAVFLS